VYGGRRCIVDVLIGMNLYFVYFLYLYYWEYGGYNEETY
jgi:hypothetical protein